MNLQIVRGDATPEEIAALVVVLSARARQAAAAADVRPARTAWADRSTGLRTPLTHGPGAWRAAARPR